MRRLAVSTLVVTLSLIVSVSAGPSLASEGDWPTYQHDMARTGASPVSVGSDAYCNLTLGWARVRPTGHGINFNGPIIWNNHVICAFGASLSASYEVFNLQTGATEYSFTNAAWGGDGKIIGGDIRCTPTIASVNVSGVLTPVLFLTGGSSGSVSAFNLSGNFAVPPTLLWSANFNNSWLGHTAAMGATRYGNIIFLAVGSDECLFWTADDNRVYAAYAATGLPYTPFTGGNAGYTPFNLGQSSLKSGCTDGTYLFYTTFNPSGAGGKVIAINPADGKQAWSYTCNQAAVLFPGNTLETFEAGCSVADGVVYANSRMFDGPPGGIRGVFYRLDARNGAVLGATIGERARLTTPAIDINRAYVPGLPAYTGLGVYGGSLLAYRRYDGALIYAAHSYPSLASGYSQAGHRVEGVLSLESNSSNQLFVFNTSCYLSCYRADDGNERFSRRVDQFFIVPQPFPEPIQQPEGGMGAIGRDIAGIPHVVFVDSYGSIYDLTRKNPRARLELVQNSLVASVPYQSPADTVVTLTRAYTNTGCMPLVVSMTAAAASNGTAPPVAAGSPSVIGSRLESNSTSLADMLSGTGFMVFSDANQVKYIGRDLMGGDLDNLPDTPIVATRTTYNPSAAAVPAFLNQNPGSYPGDVFDPPFGSIVTGPGDTAGISVHVNAPLLNRGRNSFYVEFTVINDPDYYLDSPTRRPELRCDLIYFCIDDTTTLKFGAASANHRLVTNTSRIATGDWSAGPAVSHGTKIDGMIETTYQAFSAYGVSAHRQSFNSQAWRGGGETQSWVSSLGDPNFCDSKCKAALTAGVNLGEFSTDGLTYTMLRGNMVCRSYIDSVQNFDDGTGGWNYQLFKTAPYDNDSTIGMVINSKVYAVVDAPPGGTVLNNVTLDVMSIKHRTGLAVPGWKMWVYNDNDLHGRDTAYYDAAHSVGWAAGTPTPALGKVAGFIKIPFGSGHTPLVNVTAASQTTLSFLPNWDSAWTYISKPSGQYANSWDGSFDQGALYGIAWHDFAPGETYRIGLAFFAFRSLANSNSSAGTIANTADLVNKWAGFGRGDVNNDGVINLSDVIYLAEHVIFAKPGPVPFRHLGDVNDSGGFPDVADVTYLVNFYFNYGPPPVGAFVLP
ncbi:MAG: PQQ-binding-like beta-propeller repeat protein [candidate division Zixibacteria bacterium]|nr:PQQ-binding-like beta-propeller repeat protein [candidate division Zixibacteria bacterium]